MDVARRMLQLTAACMITFAGTASAFALDEGTYQIAMGPTSAPMKPGGTGTGSPVATCSPSNGSCPQPHRATRHRRARAASQR
jgi:hypothetical protein